MASGNFDLDEDITGINVTPLVDVMLVLLIIFMVTTTYIVHRSINVKLPKAETGEMGAKSRNLAFALDKNSQLFIDGKPADFASIAQTIAEEKSKVQNNEQTGPLQALITADRETPHGEVIKLIDSIRKNGINEFAINVEAEAEQK